MSLDEELAIRFRIRWTLTSLLMRTLTMQNPTEDKIRDELDATTTMIVAILKPIEKPNATVENISRPENPF